MNNAAISVPIEIFGKTYHIKCGEDQAPSLKKAAEFLQQKMQALRDNSTALSFERIVITIALNLAHQFLELEQQTHLKSEKLQQRLLDIYSTVDATLEKHSQMELEPAE